MHKSNAWREISQDSKGSFYKGFTKRSKKHAYFLQKPPKTTKNYNFKDLFPLLA